MNGYISHTLYMGSSLVYLQETLNPILKVNNTKIDISKLHSDYDSYVLTNNDKNRIKPLKDIIRNNDINFKFFITISPYKFIPDTHSGRSFISESNKFLRTKIRKFYKSDIKTWFFTEKYVVVKSAFQRVAVPGHFLFGQVATFPGLNLTAASEYSKRDQGHHQ